MGTDPHIFTEFVRRQFIKEYHIKKREKGYYYYYRGTSRLELLETIENLKKYFKINEDKFKKLKDNLVAAAI
jgi:hypothetical protein